MIVFWLAVGLLASTSAEPSAVVGGGMSYEDAKRSHEARERRSIRDLAEAMEPERPSKPKRAKTTPVTAHSMPAMVPQLVIFAPEPLGLLTNDESALRDALRMAEVIETTQIPEDEAAIALLMMMLEAT